MRQRIGLVAKLGAGVLAVLLAACASNRAAVVTVWVPPRVDLEPYRTIGMGVRLQPAREPAALHE